MSILFSEDPSLKKKELFQNLVDGVDSKVELFEESTKMLTLKLRKDSDIGRAMESLQGRADVVIKKNNEYPEHFFVQFSLNQEEAVVWEIATLLARDKTQKDLATVRREASRILQDTKTSQKEWWSTIAEEFPSLYLSSCTQAFDEEIEKSQAALAPDGGGHTARLSQQPPTLASFVR